MWTTYRESRGYQKINSKKKISCTDHLKWVKCYMLPHLLQNHFKNKNLTELKHTLNLTPQSCRGNRCPEIGMYPSCPYSIIVLGEQRGCEVLSELPKAAQVNGGMGLNTAPSWTSEPWEGTRRHTQEADGRAGMQKMPNHHQKSKCLEEQQGRRDEELWKWALQENCDGTVFWAGFLASLAFYPCWHVLFSHPQTLKIIW